MQQRLLSTVACLASLGAVAALQVNLEEAVNYTTGFVQGVPLPGDLYVPGGVNFTSEVGTIIGSILELNISGRDSTNATIADDDTENPCFIWKQVADVLYGWYHNATTGECTELARGAVRAGFHDAGTWSDALAAQGQDFGGADGSLYLFNEAVERSENNGLQEITQMLGDLAIKMGVGVADMFQFSASVAAVTCPLGPRIRTFVGRKDATQASPTNLLPNATGIGSDGPSLVALFEDKRIPMFDLVALLGAHSVSTQEFFDPTTAGLPQDTTPGIWDTNIYSDVIGNPFGNTVKYVTFPSDHNVATYAPLATEWAGYANAQNDWVEHFSLAYVRLSLTGVNNINSLTECTAALPLPLQCFQAPGATTPVCFTDTPDTT